MYIRKNINSDTRYTPRNTINLLFGYKSHETCKIRANKLQESLKN
jgi:hypothetical protein